MPTLPLIVTADPEEPGVINICLEVSIGNEAVRAVIDTGGGSSVFAATSETQELNAIGPATSRGASGTVAPDEVVILPRLALGPIEVYQVRANRMPVGDQRPASVGMDVLSRYRCHFKFGSKVVDVDEPVPPLLSLRPFTSLPGGQPIIPVRFGAHEATGLWDTGAGLTIVSEQFAAAHPKLFETTGQTEAVDSSGVRFSTRTATMAACEIGGIHFASTPCCIFDLSTINEALDTTFDIGLGAPLIVLSDWLFDFPDGTWAATSASTAL